MTFDTGSELAALGYDPRWMAFGLLDERDLHAQYEAFCRGEDRENTEHYRAGAIRDFFDSTKVLPDDQLDRYLAICSTQKDPILGPHYLHELLRFPGLRADQLQRLREHELLQTPGLQAVLLRMTLLHNLHRDGLTDDVFTRCLDEGDAVVQNALLGHPDMTPDRYDRLVRSGINKRIRRAALRFVRSDASHR